MAKGDNRLMIADRSKRITQVEAMDFGLLVRATSNMQAIVQLCENTLRDLDEVEFETDELAYIRKAINAVKEGATSVSLSTHSEAYGAFAGE